MAFELAIPQTPTMVGAIKIVLYENPNDTLPDESIGLVQSASYDVTILDQNGQRIRVPGDVGDLTLHLTPVQIAWLLQLMADIRALANIGFLGKV